MQLFEDIDLSFVVVQTLGINDNVRTGTAGMHVWMTKRLSFISFYFAVLGEKLIPAPFLLVTLTSFGVHLFCQYL